MKVSQTDSGLTVVEKGPLVTPPPAELVVPDKTLVVVTDPAPKPQGLVDANGNPISSQQ